ncbi:MAG: hypothetical protein IIC79_03060 [Chloroflexi bacterium]|nr:hypothetical protein [Chloroflexota bacterium]
MNEALKYTDKVQLIGLIFVLVISACNSVDVESIPSPTSTLSPTLTFTPSPVPTATATQEPTDTPTPTVTRTPEPIFLTVKVAAGCRQGPGTLYPILDYLELGYSTEVIGIGDLGEEYGEQIWYVVIGPTSGENCWVFGSLVELSSSDDSIALLTPPATRTPEPPPTINPNGLIYYLILLGTGGPVGCGDSLIAVNSGIKKTGDVEQDIINVLNALFNIKTEYSGNLYNALYQSSLKAKRVEISGRTATVYTRGTVVKPPDDCDKERFRVQVFTTVKGFNEIDGASIFANNALLGDLLEQGGK